MTYAKISGFAAEQQQLARYAKALSHPARIAIIGLLARKKMCVSGDISSELPLSRTTVSQHLQELKRLGLITGEVEGLNVCYCLNLAALHDLKTAFEAFFGAIGSHPEPECR